MMQDIAMHLLELIQNSIKANATKIVIELHEEVDEGMLDMKVQDDGCGMDETSLKHALDPFYTTRTTRHIGMGLAFMQQLCDQCNGSLEVQSEKEKGTRIHARVQISHIDCPPLGDFGEMMMVAIQASATIYYQFIYQIEDKKFVFDSNQIQELLQGVSLQDPSVLLWIKEYINQEILQMRRVSNEEFRRS